MSSATVLAVVVVALVLTGCGGGVSDIPGLQPGPQDPPADLAQARDRLVAIVDRTLAAVGDGRDLSPAPSTDPVPCEDPATGPTGTFSDGYGHRLALRGDDDADELVEQTRRHWEDQGYPVEVRDLETRIPVAFTEVDGFTLSLQVVRDKAVAELAGGTPCLPKG